MSSPRPQPGPNSFLLQFFFRETHLQRHLSQVHFLPGGGGEVLSTFVRRGCAVFRDFVRSGYYLVQSLRLGVHFSLICSRIGYHLKVKILEPAKTNFP